MSFNRIKKYLLLLFFIIGLTKAQNETENATNTTNETDPMKAYYDSLKKYPLPEIPDMLVFTDENFTTMQNMSALFLATFTEWCWDCPAYFEEIAIAMNYTKKNNIPVQYGKIDAFKNNNFSQAFNVRGAPMVFLVINGKVFLYNGEHNHYGLLRFLDKKLNGPFKVVKNLAEVEETQKLAQYVVVSTLKDKSSLLYKSLYHYAESTDRLDFLDCLDDSCLKKYGEDITLLRKFDEEIIQYSVETKVDLTKFNSSEINNLTVVNFIGDYMIETGVKFDLDKLKILFEYSRKILFYFRNDSIPEQTQYDPIFKEVAKKLRKENTYTFLSDIEGNQLNDETSQLFVVVKNDLPCIMYIDFDQTDVNSYKSYRKLNVEKEFFDKDKILNWVMDIKSGKIRKDLKSGPPFNQASIDYIGAKLVIGRTYERDVIKEKNNVCIAFVNRVYPCDLCDKYLEVFRTLGHKYKNQTDYGVIYALIDGIDNEASDIEFEPVDLPFIYLYTNALPEKKRIKFVPKNATEISADEVEEFVAENLGWNKDKGKDKEVKKEEDASKGDL